MALAELDEGLVGPPIADDRIFDCINVVLSFQNADGGWSTYENTRSYPLLEVSFPCTFLCTFFCTFLCSSISASSAASLAAAAVASSVVSSVTSPLPY